MQIKKVALSLVFAAAAVSILLLAAGNRTSEASPKAEPTPYSAAHSRIQGAPAEQPPTF
jgi:hypothetical protein